MTATTTVLSLIALVFFGGTAIEGFALVMLFGVLVCTYSAMFISTPVLLYLDVRANRPDSAEDKLPAAAKAKA
jgi:preprotein translocase subunit SecF